MALPLLQIHFQYGGASDDRNTGVFLLDSDKVHMRLGFPINVQSMCFSKGDFISISTGTFPVQRNPRTWQAVWYHNDICILRIRSFIYRIVFEKLMWTV